MKMHKLSINPKLLLILSLCGPFGLEISFYCSGTALAQTTVKAQSKAQSKTKTEIKAQVSLIDPSVVDPVGQLQKISGQVKASSIELESIAAELDKLNGELDKLEGKTAKDIDRKQFAALEKRFDLTLARSTAVEKKVGLSLSKSLKDIDNVRSALKKVERDRQQDRLKGKKLTPILSDKDLKECLKDLTDLDKTVRELQANLKDK
ncbi:MAG: hypothetical protein WC028_07665 [Candidatus Obscuribacterales bacterium]|jgi:hypothetical protein